MNLTIRLITAMLLVSCLWARGEDAYVSPVTGQPFKPGGKFTLEQIKARDERVLKKTGGFINLKAEGPLALFVDARAKATLTVDEVQRLYRLGTHLDCNTLKLPRGADTPLAYARKQMQTRQPLLLVAVIEGDETLPALSIFPEERIGLVNADRLKKGGDASVVELRISKEIWRAMGFIGGVGFSPAENDMMQPYYTLEELDANRHPYIQPMNMARMQAMWKRFGVKKARRIPYAVAVKEGWAQPPTNDFQRAVWDRVKAAQDAAKTNAPAAK